MSGPPTMTALRKYSLELRECAVRMYRTSDPGRRFKKLAVGLGGTPEADAGERDDRPTIDERAELVTLRKEVAQFKRANDVVRTVLSLKPARLKQMSRVLVVS